MIEYGKEGSVKKAASHPLRFPPSRFFLFIFRKIFYKIESMEASQLRKAFLNFFKEKGHKIVPSSSLIPQDQTVLFTTAGMQQFTLYFLGEKDVIKDFGQRTLTSIQKCFRSDDIEKVGDDTHHTFFEMLGNWSIGKDEKSGYFKERAIELALEFLTEKLNLPKEKFYITIFKGEKEIPKDTTSKEIWIKFGIPEERIREFGMEDNFWGPVGKTGPCGPTTEIHFDRGEEFGCKGKDCGPNCPACQRFIEIWNLVFMEYEKDEKGNYKPLFQKSVDTGAGFERLMSVLWGENSAYETELFFPLIKKIEKESKKKYLENKRFFRIIADHIRAAVFVASEGVLPSNVERGYVLRRLIRRAIRYGKLLELKEGFLLPLAKEVIEIYKDPYFELKSKEEEILTILEKEEERFEKTLEKGLKELEKLFKRKEREKILTGKETFYLYESFGFPLELTKEIAKEKGFEIDEREFKQELLRHKEVSRKGAEKKFGGLGKTPSYNAIKLHTATHLLHEALRRILGEHVRQMGSDITSERLRFDFSHPKKLTPEEIRKVEELVNEKIRENLPVKKEEMKLEDALKSGALSFFKEKYPKRVSVYFIGDFSKEICAGPHVKNTGELGTFKIIKEESVGGGVRRIKAILK